MNAPTNVRHPQLAILPALVRNLYGQSSVQAVYLAGSLGRGGGDEWSDLDLQVHMNVHFKDFLDDAEIQAVTGEPPVVLERFKLGPDGWMHHMILPDGTFLDLLCRTEPSTDETRFWMYLPAQMTSLPQAVSHHPKAWTPKPISPAEVATLVSRYWIVMHKHRRMARRQDLAIWTGIHYSMALLVRLEFVADTGQDCGDLTQMGIYELSGVNNWLTQSCQGPNLNPFPDDCARTDWEGQVRALLKSGRDVTQRLSNTWVLTPDPSPLVNVVSQGLVTMMTR